MLCKDVLGVQILPGNFATLGAHDFKFRTMASHCVTIVKEREAYIFVYDHESVPALMQTLASLAADPASSFSPLDAAAAGKRVLRLLRDA